MPNEENKELTPIKISDFFVRSKLAKAIDHAVNELIKQYQKFFEELAADTAVLYDFLKSNDMTLEEFENIDLFDFMEKYDDYAEKHSDIAKKGETTNTSVEAKKLTALTISPEQWYAAYMPAFSNTIASFKEKKANIKELEDIAEVQTKHGTLKIIDYSKLKGKKLNTPAKKILDMCILKISQTLVYGAANPNNRYVSFTIEELAKLMDQPLETEKQRDKFIERVYECTKPFTFIRWTQSNESKKIKHLNYSEIPLFEYIGKEKNVFKFMFTQTAAYLLANSPVCESFPTNLFKLDNRYGGNAYEIGRKMIRHTDNYTNRKKGNNCTLSVEKLIENSDIPTFYDIIELQKRRDWKEKIKKPLEKALNDLLNVAFLSRWEYRTPTGERLTPMQANELNSNEYQYLVIDFSILYSEEEQTKRLKTDTKLIEQTAN